MSKEERELEKEYYIVDLEECKSKIKQGQLVWLKDDISAKCVKLHPQILPFIGDTGKIKDNGKKYTANWIDVLFEDDEGNIKEVTVCDSYLNVLLKY